MKMKDKFFKVVLNDVVVKNWWTEHLDLILDDEKFEEDSGWTCGKKRKLTNAIYKRLGSSLRIIRLKEGYALKDPAACRDYSEFACFTSDGGAVCANLFRHLRNAIAHRQVKLLIHDRQRFYYFRDYTRKGELTAEILISHETLSHFCAKYGEITRQISGPSAEAA